MISYAQARALLDKQADSFGRERVPLAAAAGRVLSEAIKADRDYPPFNRASVDGYALRWAALEKGIRRFIFCETIYAGMAGKGPLGDDGCYKIMTGAPVPEDADLVIRREDVLEGEGGDPSSIRIGDDPVFRPFQNIARKGEDLRSGDLVIGVPSLCTPALLGLLASLGRESLWVERRPRVALLTTGDEVVPVDAVAGAHQIRNSNRWVIESYLKNWGIPLAFCDHLPDRPSVIRERLVNTLTPLDNTTIDLLILTGGVSAGDADHIPALLEELGVKKLFHKLAIRPGKPVWCGQAKNGEGAMIFALPGNPLSCLSGFVLLVAPWLRACFGLPETAPLGLPLLTKRKKRTNLDEFFPVRITGSPAGLEPLALNGSGDIRMGLGAQALALHPAQQGDLEEGAVIPFYPL